MAFMQFINFICADSPFMFNILLFKAHLCVLEFPCISTVQAYHAISPYAGTTSLSASILNAFSFQIANVSLLSLVVQQAVHSKQCGATVTVSTEVSNGPAVDSTM
jgi:hypothetical protein